MAPCRLVNKGWNESILECIRRSRKPVTGIKIRTYKKGDAFRDDSPGNKAMLRNVFTGLMERGAKSLEQNKDLFPTLSLEVSPDFLAPKAYPKLLNFWTNCASGLVEMQLDIGMGDLPSSFTGMPALTKLHKLRIVWWSSNKPQQAGAFIQSIFNASPNLKIVELNLYGGINYPGFEELCLPSTLTSVHVYFQGGQRVRQLLTRHLLTRHPLHHLSNLALKCTCSSIGTDDITSILDHVSTTLRHFCLTSDREGPQLAVQFPVMPKLEHVVLSGEVHIQLGTLSAQESLPQLRTLELKNNELGLSGRATSATLHNAVHLEFKPGLWSSADKLPFQLSPQQVESVRLFFKAFSSLQKLHLRPVRFDGGAIRCVFEELSHLTHLHILYEDSIMALYDREAVLIGVSTDTVRAFERDPGCWEHADWPQDTLSSIQNLTELESLTLGTKGDEGGSVLISDAVFHLAFLKMPNLQALTFHGRLRVSRRMAQKWRELGREIDCRVVDKPTPNFLV